MADSLVQYEYDAEPVPDPKPSAGVQPYWTLVDHLNKRGYDGWQMTGVVEIYGKQHMVFCRPLSNV